MGNLPTRKGPWIGRGNERQMMSESDVQGIRKRYRTNPDGSTTMLKTRGGWPQFTTTEPVRSSAKFTSTGVLQATTSISGIWSEARYLSKSRSILLKPSAFDFLGHVNWFDQTDVVSFPITFIEFGSWAKLAPYGMGDGNVYLNGTLDLDLSQFVHPDYDEYSINAEVVCAGRSGGVSAVVLKLRYYMTTTSELVFLKKTGLANYCGLLGWEAIASTAVGWEEPRFVQPPRMNGSGTEFSAVVADLVDTSNPLAHKYQLKVMSWALPTFTVTDSHHGRRRDYQRPTPYRPGIEEVVSLPGGLNYVHAVKAAASYGTEESVVEFITEAPAFVDYDGDEKVCVLKLEESKETSTLNVLHGTDRTFSNEQHWSHFDLGETYANNLSLMQSLVFQGGVTLSSAQAESHAESATYGGTSWPVLTGTISISPAQVVGRSADHRYFYWQDRTGSVVYVPHPKFPNSQPLAQRLANSFRSVKYRGGIQKGSATAVWTLASDSTISGDEEGGVIRRTTISVDRSPTLSTVSYHVPHPSGGGLPGINVNVTRLVTSYLTNSVPDEVLLQAPETLTVENEGDVAWYDSAANLYVKVDEGGILRAKFGDLEGVGPGVGGLPNLGAYTPVSQTKAVISSGHVSRRILGCSIHPSLEHAAIVDLVDPSSDPVAPVLIHAAPPGTTRVVSDQSDGEHYVSAVYFRK